MKANIPLLPTGEAFYTDDDDDPMPKIWDYRLDASQSVVKLWREGGKVFLIGLISFFANLPNEDSASVSSSNISEVCEPRFVESVGIRDLAIEKEGASLFFNFLPVMFRPGNLGFKGNIDCYTRTESSSTLLDFAPSIGFKLCAGNLVKVETCKESEIISRGLSRVYDFYRGSNLVTDLMFTDVCLGNVDIGPQFALGMSLARPPQFNRIDSQHSRKRSYRYGTDQRDDSVVSFTPRQEIVFAGTWILISVLPFIAAWFGYVGYMRACYSLIVTWWGLIASVLMNLGGLWN
jgi:hypothetical protein